jgi:hypothetical protein
MSTITLQLSSELKQQIISAASKQGIELNLFILNNLQGGFKAQLRSESPLANSLSTQPSPSSLLEECVCVEEIDGLRLFKFTETLQARLENLLLTNEINELSEQERAELDSLNELDRFFTYLNARLLAPQ